MPKVEFEFTADECFVVVDGKRIATRIDGTWVSLEPGLVVLMSKDYETITIENAGARTISFLMSRSRATLSPAPC